MYVANLLLTGGYSLVSHAPAPNDNKFLTTARLSTRGNTDSMRSLNATAEPKVLKIL